jgi:hypothetical protein
MLKRGLFNPAVISALGLLVVPTSAQCVETGWYKIVSGTFSECCGIAGQINFTLPTSSQGFVYLEVGPQTNLASMSFIGQDMHTVFTILPCPVGAPIPFKFDYGFISSTQIVFHADPGPNGFFWSLTAATSPNALRIDGTVGLASQCIDAFSRFTYSNVVAVLVPTPSIRVSEIEVCWNTASNHSYQVQYRSSLTTNAWTDLGLPRTSTGSFDCLSDKVVVGAPPRFYRVLVVQ